MTQERNFTEVQLKNLRLWQLTLMCKKARIAEALVAEMDIPLRTTPLVLVQSSPITIQFSPDEKQFAVEGSYNIRYEIIKKRIDKSTIRGTGERLTQPGQLAVIYSQEKEFEEYRRRAGPMAAGHEHDLRHDERVKVLPPYTNAGKSTLLRPYEKALSVTSFARSSTAPASPRSRSSARPTPCA